MNKINTEDLLKEIQMNPSLLERANPVFNTAKLTLFQLAAAGDENAQKIVEALNLTEEETQTTNNGETSITGILAANAVVLQTRYQTMLSYLLKSKNKTVVDLPCGYTPRALAIADESIKYVGCDLQAVITELSPVIENIATSEQKKYISYHAVDATNYDSLKKVFDTIDGEVIISTEGLMMYFTESELTALCTNIAALLKEHGGCWITPDVSSAQLFFAILNVLFGDKAMEAVLKTRDVVAQKSDVTVGNNLLGRHSCSDEEKASYLAKFGLAVREVSFSDYMPKMKATSIFNDDQYQQFLHNMEGVLFYVITLKDKEKVVIPTTHVGDEQFLSAQMVDKKLELRLRGRIDSINAPNLLAFYEEIENNYDVECIEINCSELEYLSSAGLRILLIMVKKHPDKVTLTNVKPFVKEILDQMGFTDFFSFS